MFKGGNEQLQVINAKQVLFDAEVKVKELNGLCQKAETDLAFLESEIESKSKLSEELKKSCEALLADVKRLSSEVKSAEDKKASMLLAIDKEMALKISEKEALSSEIEEAKKKHEFAVGVSLKKVAELDSDISAKEEKRNSLDAEAKKIASEILVLEDKKGGLVSEVSELADKRSAALVEKEAAEGALSDLKKQMADLSVAVSNATVRLEQVNAWAEEAEKKAEEKKVADRAKLEEEFSLREKELSSRESSVAKRASWNEDVRQKLIAYKTNLEKHFKKEFPDLVI